MRSNPEKQDPTTIWWILLIGVSLTLALADAKGEFKLSGNNPASANHLKVRQGP